MNQIEPRGELEPGRYPIYFEATTHSLFSSGTEAVYQSVLETGDISLSDWGGAIVERLSTYEPSLLAIDSAVPTPPEASTNKLAVEDKAVLLTLTPGAPGEINGSDKISVLAGDVNVGIEHPTSLKSITRRGLGGLVLVGALAAAGELADRGVQKHAQAKANASAEKNGVEPELIDRRNFLSRLGIITAAGVTAGPIVLSQFSNRAIARTGQVLAVMGSPLRPIWYPDGFATHIDGRTALLIEKSIIARDNGLIIEGPGSILMGSSHLNKSDLFLNDSSARRQAIGDLASNLAAWAEKADTDEHVSARKLTAFNQMVLSQMVEIRELPPEELAELSPRDRIDASVNMTMLYRNERIESIVGPILG